jgi:hypothetical protein
MFLLDDYFDIPGMSEAMIFVYNNIDLIERSIAKADMIFESWFTTEWIENWE